MRCAEASERLSGWLDGELEPAAARELAEHLERCEPCRRRRDLLAAISREIRALPKDRVSEGFDARLRRRLDAEAGGPRYRGRGRRLLRAVALPGLGVGLAAALLIAVVRAPRRSDSPAPPAAASRVEGMRAGQEWLALDCRRDATGGCRADAPCATAETCGDARIQELAPATWGALPASAPRTR